MISHCLSIMNPMSAFDRGRRYFRIPHWNYSYRLSQHNMIPLQFLLPFHPVAMSRIRCVISLSLSMGFLFYQCIPPTPNTILPEAVIFFHLMSATFLYYVLPFMPVLLVSRQRSRQGLPPRIHFPVQGVRCIFFLCCAEHGLYSRKRPEKQ